MPRRCRHCADVGTSVDNGSEFKAEFEDACAERGIRLFVRPPRSPKLHGAVERANRTHTEEFYELSAAEPTVAALGAELRAWETVHNTVRPHQALGYLTPAEFLASLASDVQRTYRTSTGERARGNEHALLKRTHALLKGLTRWNC